jgi:RNA polymerase sigma-70 factor (ECF subfamily)
MSQATGQPRLSDESLVLACQQGDASAFGRLVERYQDRVYNLILRMVAHVEDARDLTQDAFLHALGAIGRFKGKAGFYTWLFRIACNVALSHRRRGAKAAFLSLQQLKDDTGIEPDFQLPDRRQETVSAGLQRQDAGRRVADALAALGDVARAIVLLKDVEGCDYEKIAGILQLPLRTVKSRLHRARMELRDRLADVI